MYSCPTDDIHSIYLDKELPFEYQKLYEEHIRGCPECSRKLERMKKIKEFLSSAVIVRRTKILLNRVLSALRLKCDILKILSA